MATLKGRMLEGCQEKHWNIDCKGRDQEAGLDIDGKNKLRRLLRKEELNGWIWWRRRLGMTEIEGGFCPKLDHWIIGDMRLDEEETIILCPES